MANKNLSLPPLPEWWGVDPGAREALVSVAEYRRSLVAPLAVRRLQAAVTRTTQSVRAAAEDLKAARTAEEKRAAQGVLKAKQKQLRDLREDFKSRESTVLRNSQIPDDELLEFVLSLPGVFGVRLSREGHPIVGVRTWFDHKSKRYDMGDFEIELLNSAILPDVWRISMIRTGATIGQYHFYYSSNSFCFGERWGELDMLARQAQVGELLHLMIACMNDVNKDDARASELKETYTVIDRGDPVPKTGVQRRYSKSPRLRKKSSKSKTPTPT